MEENNNIQPTEVSIAIKLLYLSIIISVPKIILELYNLKEGISPIYAIFINFFALSIVFFFTYKTGKGKNWARITLLVLAIIGAPYVILLLIEKIKTNPISFVLVICQNLMQVVAFILLFKKSSNNWFKLVK